MKKLTVLVIFGGCSSEYSVSLSSAYAVLSALDAERFEPLCVGITREGSWLYYDGDIDRIPDDDWQSAGVPCAVLPNRGEGALAVFGSELSILSFDCAFPVLHGKNGEDGTVQGVIELCGAPLIGCGVLSSALCMDKDRAHRLVEAEGIAVPLSRCFCRRDSEEDMLAQSEALGLPLFVKPVRAGSSFGVTRVERRGELLRAIRLAFEHDDRIIVEQAISGFEVGCAVMGVDELTVGLVDEIELSGGFFNFEEKYTLKTSRIHCPARISAEKSEEIRALAARIYRILDCRCFARVDMFLTPEGRMVFNEVNTIPGFTSHSRYPTMMKGIGLDFTTLLTKVIELGMKG